MAVTVDYQVWDSASYNWFDNTTPTAATQQINDKLSAWITAVNANPSNSSKQVTILKGPADSASSTYFGWALSFDSPSIGAPFYTRFHTNSATNFYVVFGSGWNDDGAQGGYGGVSAPNVTDSGNSFLVSGVEAEFVVASDTADGQEFFCLGWRQNNSTSYSDAILFFKDNNGEWVGVFTDNTVATGTYYMPSHATRNYNIDLFNIGANHGQYILAQVVVSNNSSSSYLPAYGNEFTACVTPTNPALYFTRSTVSFGLGKWANAPGGLKAVCVAYSPIWVVY